MTRGHPCSFSQPWSHNSFSGIIQWGPSNSGQAGNDHTDWFGCSDLQHKFPALWGSCAADPAPGSVIGTRGDRGSTIPYLGFVEVNLQILGIKNYIEDVLLLFIPTMTYSETIPIMVGSKIIDRAMSLMTKGELMKVTMMYRKAHFGAVMSGSLQLPCTSSNETRVEKEVSHSSLRDDPVEDVEILPQQC